MSSATPIDVVLLSIIVLSPIMASGASLWWGLNNYRHGRRRAANEATTSALTSEAQNNSVHKSALITVPLLELSPNLESHDRDDLWNRRVQYFTILASLLSLGASVFLWWQSFWDTPSTKSLSLLFPVPISGPFVIFYVDALSVYFLLLVNVVALLASCFSGQYLDSLNHQQASASTDERHPAERWEFYLYFNLFHASMLLVCLFDNLILLWIGIQLTTVVSAPLVGHARSSREAQEAAWKYILISSAGILFALLGTILLLSALVPQPADANMMSWSHLFGALSEPGALAKEGSEPLIELAFLLIVLGYGTKAGLFPMHTWLPDAHGQAPHPVSALLSGVLLKSALYAILRLFILTNLALNGSGAHPQNHFGPYVLLAVGLISLLMAVPFIVRRRELPFKRVLAYHSLEHMGIIVFGFGLAVPIALFGALLHTLNHALTKALMFLTYGTIQTNYADELGIDAPIRAVLRNMPAAGTVLALGGLALVGAPPFNIFLSEFIILWGAIQAAAQSATLHESGAAAVYIGTIGLFILSVTLIFSGLVLHLGRILLGKKTLTIQEQVLRTSLLTLLLFVILYLGFTTTPLTGLISSGAEILCKGACQQ